MTIKLRLILAAILSMLVVALVIGVSFITINAVQIKGELYTKIILSKDLLADILPPPEHIIETRLITYAMLTSDTAQIAELKTKLLALKKEFMNRQAYWFESDVESSMKKLVLNEVKNSALSYFEITEKEFLPAIDTHDLNKAQALVLGKLKTAYDTHRNYVDQLVILANQEAQKDEARADSALQRGFITLLLTAFLGVFLLLSILALTSRSILKNINRLKSIAESLASEQGDLSNRLAIVSSDEIAQTSRNFNLLFDKFEQNVLLAKEEEKKIKEANEQIHQHMKRSQLMISLTDLMSEGAIHGSLAIQPTMQTTIGTLQSILKLNDQTSIVVQNVHQSTAINILKQNAETMVESSESTETYVKASVQEVECFKESLGELTTNANAIRRENLLISYDIFIELAKLDHIIFKLNAYNTLFKNDAKTTFGDHHQCRLG
ncbi:MULTISPECIES: HAMP domain-containing protein [unclassified Sulfurospirillum]|uniref:methyl-accepting chemotaxis protein n=1 Tax=unclassified Sulfurospirillum TaxID=2618290 RepID=UPI0025DC2BC4|nr:MULTISPECIES: HAMP domain-containing protein [unclassified Sulfurospirillum]